MSGTANDLAILNQHIADAEALSSGALRSPSVPTSRMRRPLTRSVWRPGFHAARRRWNISPSATRSLRGHHCEPNATTLQVQ